MYRRVMAFDLDGTLAREGKVPPELEDALERCRALGHALFLVTGRRFESLPLGRLPELCTGIVWENGAVLSHPASGELYLPFGQISPFLLKALDDAAIPFERGLAIAATWMPYDKRVWEILSQFGGGASIEYNKGAVMLIPTGAAKGAGLERLMTICGYSPRNLAAFGDAENDLSMLRLAEVGVAVGDAVPTLLETADVVASQGGPAGVLEILGRYPLAGEFLDVPLKRERLIPVGQDEHDRPVSLPAARLAGRNLGVFGDSGTGKSWMVGLLAEGMHHEDYQVLIVDPEGDFRGLRALPRFIALEGDLASLPSPPLVVALLEAGGVSVVLDLSRYPVTHRADYVMELFRAVRPLRERKYRPHWIVLEEAQQFLTAGTHDVAGCLLPLMADGGVAIVSYSPCRLQGRVLQALHQLLLTRITKPQSLAALAESCQTCIPPDAKLETIPTGMALLSGGTLARLRPGIRRVTHIRHLFKYLDTPLPPHKRFWFRDERGGVGAEAASLFEFSRLIPVLPIESLEYHDRHQDFSRWADTTFGDAELAAHLRKLSNRQLSKEALREALRRIVAERYEELNMLR
jgi:hydroxymethylpyrimidine pyrophosphatase-like HAD family hydrolase